MQATLPIWRSLLYVPVNVPRFVGRAVTTDADAIQLDLEDSIAPTQKNAARALVAAAAERIAAGGADVVVRINRALSLAVRDIEASVGPYVTALSLPKVESADHVKLLSETISEAELRAGVEVGATRIIVGIEGPQAWLDMHAIAKADSRIVAMLLGSEDFSSSVGMNPSPDNLLGPKQALVIAAAAAGVRPLGLVGSFANFRDKEGFAEIVRRSREIGFLGSSCIHPDQIPALNKGFSPSEEEMAQAQRIVAAFEDAKAKGLGAISLDGAMIDPPVVDRAAALVSLSNRISERSAA